jgi:polysaccharide deacetylase family protein (PEP-CTERM system associated)
MITHCLSIDLEGFCESGLESFSIPGEMLSGPAERAEVEANTLEILDFLDEFHIQGTFFTLGKIGEAQPELIRRIAARGHEIASHSYQHLRLNNLPAERLKEVLSRSKKVLEDASGTEVRGFRAPEFSVNAKSLFILDYIREAGYAYDSSLYPISGNEVYGHRHACRWIHALPNGLVEFPPSLFEICGWRFPALGGVLFRLYPFTVTRRILRVIERAGYPAMIFIHPYELGSTFPDLRGLPRWWRMRRYFNLHRVKERFTLLFRTFRFGRAYDILKANNFLS